MNRNKALEVMLTEKCCVERQEDASKCDRRCGECDLLLPTEEVLQAYDFVINMLTEKKRPKGEWKVIGRNVPNNIWHVFCPKCNCDMFTEFTSYCPNCGEPKILRNLI